MCKDIHAFRLSESEQDEHRHYNKVFYHVTRYDENKEGDRQRALDEVESYLHRYPYKDWLVVEGNSLVVYNQTKIK
jgi:hypothetical protein